MTRYVLDTSALIDVSLGREPVQAKILEMMTGRDEVAVSAVQVAEFFSGVSPIERPTWKPFLDSMAFWEISRWAAEEAGIYRYDFARRGVSLSTADTLIAAVSKEHASILVTNNAKDFPMLDVELLVLSPETR